MTANLILKSRIFSLSARLVSPRHTAGKQKEQTHAQSTCWWIPVDGKISRDERALSSMTLMALVAGFKRF